MLTRQLRLAPNNLFKRLQHSVPWFVHPSPSPLQQNVLPSEPPSVPQDAPDILKHLHAQLIQSPHLEKSALSIAPAILPQPGPPLPLRSPQGRRKRGGTYPGVSAYDTDTGGLWNWVVSAQVKEGTEGRGSIQSVVRLVRKTLLNHSPPLELPSKSGKQKGVDWVMIDGGQFAIHILSKAAREKYFNNSGEW
ncbi:hypothetical protein CVT24_007011 [Panaeolus cyanescens]|uniref:Uncharacterized protein n=1 Tax=Panaeolus cyanescens TaxID=181874 RepID=A0A409YKH0_9AGAR|nr:hypothetical protein CVT24_007011 [Panaeolus cyanescens]